MAVGSRAGKKQGGDPAKGAGRGRSGVEKALAKARAQLDKRRRQVEKALARVARLEVRSILHDGDDATARATHSAAGGTSPRRASSSPSKAPAKPTSKPAPAKPTNKPAAAKPAAAKPAAAKPAAAASVGHASRRKSVKPRSAGMSAPDR